MEPDEGLYLCAMFPLRRVQFVWCAHYLLGQLVLIYPVYAIMMERHGIGPFKLSVLLALWSFSAIAAEVPTGALADRVSRPLLLMVSRIMKGCCFLTWFILPGFWGYLAGFLCWGLASTLSSGTEESMLHDALLKMERRDQFEKVYGRAVAAGHVGVITSFVVGGFLAERVGFGLPLGLSVAGPWLSAVVVAKTMSDPQRSAARSDHASRYVDTVRAGLHEVRSSRSLLQIVSISATVACVWGVAEEFLPVFLEEKERFTLAAVGLILACTSVVSVVATSFAHRLPKRSLEAIALTFGLANGLLLVSIAVDGLLAAVLLVASAGVNCSGGVLLAGHLQRSIRGPARATVTSVINMSREVGGIVLYMAVGIVASITSWHAGIGVVSAVTVALCAGLVIVPAGRRIQNTLR